MGLNLEKIKEKQKSFSSGTGRLFNTKEMGSELYYRVLPPAPDMDECFFVTEKKFFCKRLDGSWLVLTSPASFGKTCPIQDELNQALREGDPELTELVALFKEETAPIMPIIRLGLDDDDEPYVLDDDIRFFESKSSITGQIYDLASNRLYAKNTGEFGILDPVKGRNFSTTKTGSGTKTRYATVADPETWEIPVKFLELDYSPVPFLKKMIRSEDYLRGAVRAVLYDEPFDFDQDDPGFFSEDVVKPKTAKRKSAKAVKKTPKKSTKKTSRNPILAKLEEDED